MPGGLALESTSQCDDGNLTEGDGCSPTCGIEPGFVCQQRNQSQGNQISVCILETDATLKISSKSLVPFTYELEFNRKTNLNKDIMNFNYRLKLDNGESSENHIPVSFILYIKSQDFFLLEIDGFQFDKSYSGKLYFESFSENRILQGGPETVGIIDEESMPVSLEGVKVDFEFDYDAFRSKESLKATVDSIDKITGNSFMQTTILLLSLNPLMFSFSANILNRFIYFRGLKTIIPSNLNSMFAIIGSSWGVKSGKTDYEDNSGNVEKKGMDKWFNIEASDQDPPLKFKEMKFTDIYIKSALPIILTNFALYLVVLLIILINKSLQESEVDRLKRVAKMKAKDAALQLETPKFKKTVMKTFQFAELHFKWNAMIRTNLLIYQNFTLGLFLNLAKGYKATDKAFLKVSFVLSVISLLVIYCNGYILYYIVEKEYQSKKNMLLALREKRELIAQQGQGKAPKIKVFKKKEVDTIDDDLNSSVMELKRGQSKGKKVSVKNRKKLKKIASAQKT